MSGIENRNRNKSGIIGAIAYFIEEVIAALSTFGLGTYIYE